MRPAPAFAAAAAALGLTVAAGVRPVPALADPESSTVALRGRLVLTDKGRVSNDRTLDLSSAAVWFDATHGAARPRPLEVEMATARKKFAPRLLVVPVGSTVRFPNLDPILHNVFSVSGANSFDLGLVGSGKGKSARFGEAGIVRVFCNVHHAMFAHVVVVDTPFYAQPAADGSFELEGLPRGPGRLHVWQERAEPVELAVDLPLDHAVEVRLEVSRPRVPPHRDKFGRDYYESSAYE